MDRKKIKYNWKRFWIPRDGVMDLSDNGFLVDPDEYSLYGINSEIISIDEVLKLNCIGLLGEPGAGKTSAINDLRNEKLKDLKDKHIDLDLRSYASEERLFHDIFKSPKFEKWINSTYELVITLDSFDECLIHKSNISSNAY